MNRVKRKQMKSNIELEGEAYFASIYHLTAPVTAQGRSQGLAAAVVQHAQSRLAAQMTRRPVNQHGEHGEERLRLRGQPVLRRAGPVRAGSGPEYVQVHEPPQPLGEDARADPQFALEVGEPAGAEERGGEDAGRPAVTEDLHGLW